MRRKKYAPLTEEQRQLVEDNMGLVFETLGKMRNKGYENDDLVQVASIGLIRAAMGFEPDKGFAFTTYAVRCIKNAVWGYETYWTAKSRNHYLEARSLDDLAHKRNGNEYGVEADELIALETVESQVMADLLMDIVNGLENGRQKEVVLARLDGRTLTDIGREYGISRARVSQILQNAQRHVRARWGA